MEKKIVLTAVCISVLLFSAVAGTQLLNLGRADPYLYYEDVPPPPGTPPIVLSMLSPQNNTSYDSSNVNINFTVSFNPNSTTYEIFFVNFTDDWQTNATYAYKQNIANPQFPHFISYSSNLTDIPKGNHTITIYAAAGGGYAANGLVWDEYYVQNSWIINFSVEIPKPVIIVPENIAYNKSSVPLVFTVRKSATWVGYSLDGKDNVTINGNTTLTGLSNGLHNLTVYANDTFGNMAASETVTFTIAKPESFPTALVATASGASAAVACLGLLVYFKKHKPSAHPNAER